MMILRVGLLLTGFRIVVQSTVLQTAIPAPRASASKFFVKFIFVVEPACKDVGTCVIFEAPALTPRTLLTVFTHSFLWLRFLRGNVSYRAVHTDRKLQPEPALTSNFYKRRTTLDNHFYIQNRVP